MSRRDDVWERKRQAFLARPGDVAPATWRRGDGWVETGETGVANGANWPNQGDFEWGNEVFLLIVCMLFGMIMFYQQIYGVELIQYILQWGKTRVSLLVLHGSDTKETKFD